MLYHRREAGNDHLHVSSGPARVVNRCCQRDMLPYAPDISLALDQDFTEVGIGVVYSGDFPVLGRRTSQNRKFFVVLLRSFHISCLNQSVATPFGTGLSCSRSILPLDVVYKGPLAVLHSSLLLRTHTLSLSLYLSLVHLVSPAFCSLHAPLPQLVIHPYDIWNSCRWFHSRDGTASS